MKRLFAKKTKNIKSNDSRNIVSWVKVLQMSSESLAKKVRAAKQTLKNSKDVEDPTKINQLAKKLFGKGNESIVPAISDVFQMLHFLSGSLGMNDTQAKIDTIYKDINNIPTNEQPEVPGGDDYGEYYEDDSLK